MESFIIVILLGLLAFVIIVPIVAVVIAVSARRRIARLEWRASRLEQTLAAHSIFPKGAEPAPQPEPKPAPAPQPVAAEPPPQPTPTPVTPLTAYQIESIIGRRWIGELGRVTIGVAFGIAMSLGGLRYQQRGWRIFSQVLTAGGIVLLYLSTYAAFGYYHLVGQKTAFAFLGILIAEAAALSLVFNAPAIAIMALVGGFLTPVLLHSQRDQYPQFFAYLIALDAGALALMKHWRGLSSLAYFGTQLLFWLWYNDNYHQQKRGAVLIFQTAIF